MKVAFLAMLSAVCICPVWGQIAQSHSEYCGLPGGANPPLTDISATVDQRAGHTTLYLGPGSGSVGLPLEGSLISEIVEVCPLSDGRLVVFGDMGGAIAIYLLDKPKAVVVDSFWAYSPVISPDQRWIAYVKFYPLHGVEGSDEYMIYDLSKTPTQNRPADEPKESIDVGKVIFPPGHQNFPGSNTQLPQKQRHLGGMRLYWASDSRAVLFEDRITDSPGVVLVTLDEKGTPTAFRHALTQAEICGRDVHGGTPHTWTLDRAEIGPDFGGGRAILVDLGPSGDNRCSAHVLQLYREAFQRVKTEVNGRPAYTRGAVMDSQEVIPQKKKK